MFCFILFIVIIIQEEVFKRIFIEEYIPLFPDKGNGFLNILWIYPQGVKCGKAFVKTENKWILIFFQALLMEILNYSNNGKSIGCESAALLPGF